LLARPSTVVNATPDGRKVYVEQLLSSGQGVIEVFDVTHGQPVFIKSLAMGVFPFNGTFSPDGRHFWVPIQGAGKVAVIDTTTDAVVHTIDEGAWVGPPVFDGNKAYIPVGQYQLPQNIVTAFALFVVQPAIGSVLASPAGQIDARPLLDQPTDLRAYDANTFAPLPEPTVTLPSYSFQMSVARN
jgi:DNA-binding beta-propeller fold protein YncE